MWGGSIRSAIIFGTIVLLVVGETLFDFQFRAYCLHEVVREVRLKRSHGFPYFYG